MEVEPKVKLLPREASRCFCSAFSARRERMTRHRERERSRAETDETAEKRNRASYDTRELLRTGPAPPPAHPTSPRSMTLGARFALRSGFTPAPISRPWIRKPGSSR